MRHANFEKWANCILVQHESAVESGRAQPKQTGELEDAVEWNPVKNEISERLGDEHVRDNYPVDEPHCIVVFVVRFNRFERGISGMYKSDVKRNQANDEREHVGSTVTMREKGGVVAKCARRLHSFKRHTQLQCAGRAGSSQSARGVFTVSNVTIDGGCTVRTSCTKKCIEIKEQRRFCFLHEG